MDRLGLMVNGQRRRPPAAVLALAGDERAVAPELAAWRGELLVEAATEIRQIFVTDVAIGDRIGALGEALAERSEEHTSELQSLMRNSYDVFCLKNKNKQ